MNQTLIAHFIQWKLGIISKVILNFAIEIAFSITRFVKRRIEFGRMSLDAWMASYPASWQLKWRLPVATWYFPSLNCNIAFSLLELNMPTKSNNNEQQTLASILVSICVPHKSKQSWSAWRQWAAHWTAIELAKAKWGWQEKVRFHDNAEIRPMFTFAMGFNLLWSSLSSHKKSTHKKSEETTKNMGKSLFESSLTMLLLPGNMVTFDRMHTQPFFLSSIAV